MPRIQENNDDDNEEQEIIAAVSNILGELLSDPERVSGLTKFFVKTKSTAKALAAMRKDLKKHPRLNIRSIPITAIMPDKIIPGFRIAGINEDFGLLYYAVVQQLILENDEYIYSMTVCFYLIIYHFGIAVPIIMETNESIDFADIEFWISGLKESLPCHTVLTCELFAKGQILSEDQVIEISRDYFFMDKVNTVGLSIFDPVGGALEE